MKRTVAILLLASGLSLNPLESAAAKAEERAVSLEDVSEEVFTASREKDLLTVQVLLNRARFSAGVIDGMGGANTKKAIETFERAEKLEVDGEVDDRLISRLEERQGKTILRRYTITEEDAKGPFAESIPESLEDQAELERLSYTSPKELLSEKFHMDPDLLEALNPDSDLGRAGTEIIVAARREGSIEGKIARIEVDKQLNAVRVYGDDDRLLAFYPATVGSESLPSPEGSMSVEAVAHDAAYYFDPDNLSWGPDKALEIPPGPNNPVGSTWIDLSEESYGIHGSPDPELISKSASHGCVRLANWDVEELAEGVSKGVKVEFVGD